MESEKVTIQRVMRLLIQYFRKQEKISTAEEVDELWNKIRQKVDRDRSVSKRRVVFISIATSAAVLLSVIWINTKYFSNDTGKSKIVQMASKLALSVDSTKNILLVMSEEKKIQVDTDAKVSYSKEGTVAVNSKIIEEQIVDREVEYNQLIVPKGKRTQLFLSDGSKLWVNSGTRVVYPRSFTQKEREIFVDGEVYLEVFHDEKVPFIVKTSGFDVQVLGTSFNVCAYKQLQAATVVLVTGSVDVKDVYNGKSRLKPNQLLSVTSAGIGETKAVDASQYVSWTKGLLVLHAEPLGVVFNKLNLYYGQEIEFDQSVKDIPLSGKLDLKDQIEDVIRLISKTAPISYSIQDNKIKVKKRIGNT